MSMPDTDVDVCHPVGAGQRPARVDATITMIHECRVTSYRTGRRPNKFGLWPLRTGVHRIPAHGHPYS